MELMRKVMQERRDCDLGLRKLDKVVKAWLAGVQGASESLVLKINDGLDERFFNTHSTHDGLSNDL